MHGSYIIDINTHHADPRKCPDDWPKYRLLVKGNDVEISKLVGLLNMP